MTGWLWVAALAAPVWQVPVQGAVTEADGGPVNGTRSLFVRLFRDADGDGDGDTQVFEQTFSADFVGGNFAVTLAAEPTDGIPHLGVYDRLWVTVQLLGGAESSMVELGEAARATWARDAAKLDGYPASHFQVATWRPAWSDLTGSPTSLTTAGAVTGGSFTLPGGAFQVSGSGAVTGASFTGSGAGLTNIPVSGIANLSTALASYLPLSGGTLTGGLSGTSASFTGAVSGASFTGSGAGLTGIPIAGVSNLSTTLATYLPLTGGALSGGLTVNAATLAVSNATTGGFAQVVMTANARQWVMRNTGTVGAPANRLAIINDVSGEREVAYFTPEDPATGVNEATFVMNGGIKVAASAATCGGGVGGGTIDFSSSNLRICDGTRWRIVESNDDRPVMKQTPARTIAQTIAIMDDQTGAWAYGSGSVCDSGYHVCTYQEAIVLKYSFAPSRYPGIATGTYYRVAGTHNHHSTLTNNVHNALIGHAAGGAWSGSQVSCPNGAGPMVYFYNQTDRLNGVEWEGACYNDDARPWLCCRNRDD